LESSGERALRFPWWEIRTCLGRGREGDASRNDRAKSACQTTKEAAWGDRSIRGGDFDSVAVLGYNIGLEKAGGPSPLVGADPRQGAEGWALTNARACAIK